MRRIFNKSVGGKSPTLNIEQCAVFNGAGNSRVHISIDILLEHSLNFGINRMTCSFFCIVLDMISMVFMTMNQCVYSWMLGEPVSENLTVSNISCPFCHGFPLLSKRGNAMSKIKNCLLGLGVGVR